MKRNKNKNSRFRKLKSRIRLLFAHRREEQYFLIWAVLTGFTGGLAASAIRGAMMLCSSGASWCEAVLGTHYLLPMPLFALLLGYWVKHFFNGNNSSEDMALLIRAVQRHNPRLVRLETVSHIFASPVTIALGGSAGLSTSGVLAGASLGGKIGTWLGLMPAQQARLMACGTAAGISGVFDSPISGALFAMEVLLPHVGAARLAPLLLSSASAAVVSQICFGEQPVLRMNPSLWHAEELPYFILFGMFCAVVGIYMVRLNMRIEDFVRRETIPEWLRLCGGGIALTILIGFLSPVGGLGQEALVQIFNGASNEVFGSISFMRYLPEAYWLLAGALFLVIFKIVASGITLTCGGSGGYFVPALFTGAFAGVFFAALRGGDVSLITMYGALGMCGVFASSFRAPLTGIFLVLELSGGYVLMIPLIIVGVIAYFLAGFFEQNSLYLRASQQTSAHPI